jgi:hypothetical protein
MDINGICCAMKDILQLDDAAFRRLGDESGLLATRMVEMSAARLMDECSNIDVIQRVIPGSIIKLLYFTSDVFTVIADILQSCKRNAITNSQICEFIKLIVNVLICTSNVTSDMQSVTYEIY